MSHVRQQIREAFAKTLDYSLPEYNVFSSRRYSMNAKMLPAVDMKFLNENSEVVTMGNTQHRTASLYIRVTHQALEVNIDNALDDAAVAIEHAITNAGNFYGLVVDAELVQTNFTDVADGDNVLAELVMRYDILYRVTSGNVETVKG